ncbi:hypothetical protein GCM10027414_06660 [Humibacter ginsengiterrae]
MRGCGADHARVWRCCNRPRPRGDGEATEGAVPAVPPVGVGDDLSRDHRTTIGRSGSKGLPYGRREERESVKQIIYLAGAPTVLGASEAASRASLSGYGTTG